jgi:hypothetical protein
MASATMPEQGPIPRACPSSGLTLPSEIGSPSFNPPSLPTVKPGGTEHPHIAYLVPSQSAYATSPEHVAEQSDVGMVTATLPEQDPSIGSEINPVLDLPATQANPSRGPRTIAIATGRRFISGSIVARE